MLIKHPEIQIDLADKEQRTALRAASWSGHEDILKALINAGADVNSVDRQGRTSLIAASYMGHYEIVEILLVRILIVIARYIDSIIFMFITILFPI